MVKYEIFQYSNGVAKEVFEVPKVISWTSCASPAESQMQQILALITSDQTMTFKTCSLYAMRDCTFPQFCAFLEKLPENAILYSNWLIVCLFSNTVKSQVLVHLV